MKMAHSLKRQSTTMTEISGWIPLISSFYSNFSRNPSLDCVFRQRVVLLVTGCESLSNNYYSFRFDDERTLCLATDFCECLRGKGPPDRMLAKSWRRLFLAAYTIWAKPGCCCCPAWQSVCRVIAALRGRLLYVVYCVCKVERFVLTIIKRRLLLLLFWSQQFFSWLS